MSESDSSLHPTVTAAFAALCSPDERETVTDLLVEECNAEHLYTTNANLIERVQLAVLKISNGEVDKFLATAEMAQVDWRDALVVAGFGEDVNAHLKWAEEFCK